VAFNKPGLNSQILRLLVRALGSVAPTLSEKGAEGIPQVPQWHRVDPGGKSVLIVLLLG